MSARLEVLAVDKGMLLKHSALCRLRLHRAAHELRASLDWKRASFAAASASLAPPIVFGLALSLIGAGRVARVIKLRYRTDRPHPTSPDSRRGASSEIEVALRARDSAQLRGGAAAEAAEALFTCCEWSASGGDCRSVRR